MTKQEFIDWALSKGWTLDKFGHLQKTVTTDPVTMITKTYRFKLSSTHVRSEIRNRETQSWVRLWGRYFYELAVLPNGKLGLKKEKQDTYGKDGL